jgi:enoyl-[acyl-carrier protein] reductase III
VADPFALAGRFVCVTGGTRGIGRAIAFEAARAGARVLAVYARNDEAAAAARAEAERAGIDLRALRADLTADKGLAAVEEACATGGEGGTLCLVHGAATGVHRPVGELTLRHLDFTFALNVRAVFELTRRLLPRLGPGSSVVAISSAGAARAVPGYALVGASKGALESMARHFAAELAPRGVRFNVLAPGSVPTDAWAAMPDRERRLAEAAARTPRGNLVTPEEVARAARFLLSDASAGIVGHTLVVDGGRAVLE